MKLEFNKTSANIVHTAIKARQIFQMLHKSSLNDPIYGSLNVFDTSASRFAWINQFGCPSFISTAKTYDVNSSIFRYESFFNIKIWLSDRREYIRCL